MQDQREDHRQFAFDTSSKGSYFSKLSRTFLYSQDNIFHINGK